MPVVLFSSSEALKQQEQEVVTVHLCGFMQETDTVSHIYCPLNVQYVTLGIEMLECVLSGSQLLSDRAIIGE